MMLTRDLRDFFEAVFAGIKEEDGEGGMGVLQSIVKAILDDVAKEVKEAPFMLLGARQTRVAIQSSSGKCSESGGIFTTLFRRILLQSKLEIFPNIVPKTLPKC